MLQDSNFANTTNQVASDYHPGAEGSQHSDQIDQEQIDLAKSMLIDYPNTKVSTNFVFMDADMGDSDCSEEYDTEPFFQQSGLAYFKQMQELKQQLILADKQKSAEAEKLDQQEDHSEDKPKSADAEDQDREL